MLVTCDAGSAADAETRPKRPTAQTAALTPTPPTRTQPTGRKRGHVPVVAADPLPLPAERAVTDRLLDVAPGQGGEDQGGGDLEDGPDTHWAGR